MAPVGKVKTSQGTMKLALAKARMRAESKVNSLVKKGYRLNPEKASTAYNMSVSYHGTPKERRKAIKTMDNKARGKKRG